MINKHIKKTGKKQQNHNSPILNHQPPKEYNYNSPTPNCHLHQDPPGYLKRSHQKNIGKNITPEQIERVKEIMQSSINTIRQNRAEENNQDNTEENGQNNQGWQPWPHL